jgi:hypothetical protein
VICQLQTLNRHLKKRFGALEARDPIVVNLVSDELGANESSNWVEMRLSWKDDSTSRQRTVLASSEPRLMLEHVANLVRRRLQRGALNKYLQLAVKCPSDTENG